MRNTTAGEEKLTETHLQDGEAALLGQEDGAVAESGDSCQGSPGGRGLVEGGPALVLSGVGLVDLVVEPHVGHGHPVLGQGAGLVGADGGGGAQRLHSFQVLHQAVLLGHTLSSQGQTHLETGSLGSVGCLWDYNWIFTRQEAAGLTVTVARRPSGTLATMIPMRKMTASSQEYPRMRERMKKETPRKTATPVMMWMKCSISMEMGVRPTSSPEASVAMRPITVRSPVLITTPRAVPAAMMIRLFSQKQKTDADLMPPVFIPSTQLVEKKAMFLVSSGFSLEKSGVRVWGSDSPVREELST